MPHRPTFFFFAVLTLILALLLAGCGGQEDTMAVEEEKEANVEEEAPEESLPSYVPGSDLDLDICQTGEALEDLGAEGLQRLSDELAEEVSVGSFTNMQEAFASRGYTCNGQAG